MLPLATGIQRAEGLGPRECLAIEVVRATGRRRALPRLADLFVHRRLFSHTTTPSLRTEPSGRTTSPAEPRPARTRAQAPMSARLERPRGYGL